VSAERKEAHRAVDLGVDLCGVALRNPLIAAAGTCGYAGELSEVLDLRDLGALTTKSITLEGREGNPPWRIVPTELGMLNAIGLANVGLDRFLAEKVRRFPRSSALRPRSSVRSRAARSASTSRSPKRSIESAVCRSSS
jgi:dihydroorotate dehydrogenase (NAD+) catalytic subunit